MAPDTLPIATQNFIFSKQHQVQSCHYTIPDIPQPKSLEYDTNQGNITLTIGKVKSLFTSTPSLWFLPHHLPRALPSTISPQPFIIAGTPSPQPAVQMN